MGAVEELVFFVVVHCCRVAVSFVCCSCVCRNEEGRGGDMTESMFVSVLGAARAVNTAATSWERRGRHVSFSFLSNRAQMSYGTWLCTWYTKPHTKNKTRASLGRTPWGGLSQFLLKITRSFCSKITCSAFVRRFGRPRKQKEPTFLVVFLAVRDVCAEPKTSKRKSSKGRRNARSYMF